MDQVDHDARDLLQEGVDKVGRRSAGEISHQKANVEDGVPFEGKILQEVAPRDGDLEDHAWAVDSEDAEALGLCPDSIESWETQNSLLVLLLHLVVAVVEHSAVTPSQHELFHIVQQCMDQELLDPWDRMVLRLETCKIDVQHDGEEEVLLVLPWLLELHW